MTQLARVLGGYRLVRPIGTGGMGDVYEALAPDGRTVALKAFLLRDDDQGLMASAFVREASLGVKLLHPDIVSVLDMGCHAEYAFLVMELVPGHDLRLHTSRAHRLPLAVVLRAGERICRALHAAHAIQVIHRDIKPGNVLVHWPSDTLKVSDFGLARLGDAFRSRTGIVAGTPGYMSPEQLAEGAIGPYSDLYSVGVVLFELLTSRLPFEASSLGDLLSKVARSVAPLATSLEPSVPGGVAALLAELLERRPTRRPASAEAVAERLAALRASAASGPKSRG